jgi:branched-chain amino acid transport system substrate-binding protein
MPGRHRRSHDRYFVEDDQGDPTEGANAYRSSSIRNKVSVIVGTVMSKVSLAGAPIAQQGRAFP